MGAVEQALLANMQAGCLSSSQWHQVTRSEFPATQGRSADAFAAGDAREGLKDIQGAAQRGAAEVNQSGSCILHLAVKSCQVCRGDGVSMVCTAGRPTSPPSLTTF